VGAFDDPAAGFGAAALGLGFLAAGAQVQRQTQPRGDLPGARSGRRGQVLGFNIKR